MARRAQLGRFTIVVVLWLLATFASFAGSVEDRGEVNQNYAQGMQALKAENLTAARALLDAAEKECQDSIAVLAACATLAHKQNRDLDAQRYAKRALQVAVGQRRIFEAYGQAIKDDTRKEILERRRQRLAEAETVLRDVDPAFAVVYEGAKQMEARAGEIDGIHRKKVQDFATAIYEALFADLQAQAGAAPEETKIDVASAEKARTGQGTPIAIPGSFIRTTTVGGKGVTDFIDLAEARSTLVGFKCTLFEYAAKPCIKSIQPIYQGAKGPPVESRPYGQPTGVAKSILAKPGYAVGGIVARGGDKIDGFKVLFMKVTVEGLDTKDKYESEWVGGTGGFEVTLGGKGRPVVGLHGVSGDDLESFGLLLKP